MYNNQTYLFTPAQKDANQLKAEFVVRKDEFEQIFSDIKEDKMEHPPQHFMILGQRGMGKTTLLLRLKYAIEDDGNLNAWLLPVLFNEEQYAMSDLASFFEHIAELIADKNAVYSDLLTQMRIHEYEDDYDQKSFDVLAKTLKENNQKIAVFHDNFGDFLNKIGKNAIHRLRNILMNSPLIRLVGASATMLEHTYNYKEPLFDFFYQIRLNGLTTEETILLFEKLAKKDENYKDFQEKIKAGKSRIEVIRKLSGGVIRTMVMLFDVFMDNGQQDSFKDLEAILDRVTPLYKHRMDDLKPQQQTIVDAVARAWDAVTVSEISELCRAERQGLKTNQISAQLKQLVDNQIIEIETRTTGRTHLYRLQERFFNIWYLMRYSSRKDKQRVIWLVRFLEGWCDTDDFQRLFDSYSEKVKNGQYDNETVFYRALAYSMANEGILISKKLAVLRQAVSYLKENSFEIKDLNVLLTQTGQLTKELLMDFMDQASNDYSSGISLLREKLNARNSTKEELDLISFSTKRLNTNMNIVNQKIESNEGIKEFVSQLIPYYQELFVQSYIFKLLASSMDLEFSKLQEIIIAFEEKPYTNTYEILLIVLMFKEQYHSALKLFEMKFAEFDLKERAKPIYFLLLEKLKNEFPNEYLKAGPELRETIEKLKRMLKPIKDINTQTSQIH